MRHHTTRQLRVQPTRPGDGQDQRLRKYHGINSPPEVEVMKESYKEMILMDRIRGS